MENDKVDIDSNFTLKGDAKKYGEVTYHKYEATYIDVGGSNTVTLEVVHEI